MFRKGFLKLLGFKTGTRGVSKMGNTGTGTVLDFGTLCTCAAVSRVFSIYGYIIKVIRILNIIFSLVFIIFSR